MKKQLLKIANIFIVANIIFLNTGVSASFTKAYTARQKMVSLLKKEKNNEKQVNYKYLAEQLCIYFKAPKFPDKELTFNTPFGVTKLDIKSTRSIFISSPAINKYVEIAKVLDEILTPKGRKQLAGIILEYLQTNPDPDYKEKSFDTYRFKSSNFFDVIGKKSKLCFSKELRELNKQVKKIRESGLNIKKDLRTVKDKEEKDRLKNAREIVNNYEKKLGDAKEAAAALCAILMIAEPHYHRSFDGGKHERALMRDILNSGMKYADAFENFLPSGNKGGELAYKYSTNENNEEELLESNNYSEEELLESENYSKEEEISYNLEELFT